MTNRSLPAALPEGAVLLHVGPYKTGSTAIQNALFARQDRLAEHGVAYPGVEYRAARPGWSALQWSPVGSRVPEAVEWRSFADEVRALHPNRVCVSTEDFGSIGEPALARRIVDDLGGDNVHVVYVCRALHRVLPSHWQERVKSAVETRTYEEYLRSVLLPGSRDEAGIAFWRNHDLVRTADAWLPVVGSDRFHVVVTDDSDRSLLREAFESMLALPAGYLEDQDVHGNHSLSVNSVEMLRRLNAVARERDWRLGDYAELIRHGALPALFTMAPSAHDDRIAALPPWALEPASRIAAGRIELIGARGLRVIGDPECLRLPADFEPSEDVAAPLRISVDSAVALTAGVMERDYHVRRRLRGKVNRQQRRLESLTGGDPRPPGSGARSWLARMGSCRHPK